MKFLYWLPILVWAILPTGLVAAETAPALPVWAKSVVKVEVSRNLYDYYQPWSRRSDRSIKIGLVVGDRRVLTTAQELSDRTLVRLQKGGRGKWTNARVEWVDYQANLALLAADEPAFWTDLQSANLEGKPPTEGATLQIIRWREGKLENRTAEFTQYAVRPSELSSLSHVQLELDSEIQGAGAGEPVVANSYLAGIVASQRGRTCKVIPASFLRTILAARQAGNQRGLGYFHFYWQRAENLASLAAVQLSGEPRGVFVTNVPERPDDGEQVLQSRDLVLQIDGFDVDMQGDYADPEYGSLMLENLSTRGKWAGDEVKMKIWRAGRALEVSYRLPKFEFAHALVPAGVFDQPPDYLIVGGLVFQPLTVPYLQRWGNEWERRAPFRFTYYTGEEATREQPGIVILSQVLPDAFNLGYQEQRGFAVDKVNGRRVTSLTDLRAALQQPKENFHVFDFVPNESLQRIVLAAGDSEREATQRILDRFGIATAIQITPNPANGK